MRAAVARIERGPVWIKEDALSYDQRKRAAVGLRTGNLFPCMVLHLYISRTRHMLTLPVGISRFSGRREKQGSWSRERNP